MTLQRNPANDRRARVDDDRKELRTRGRAADWRATLRNPRWNVAPIKNPEMNPTRRPMSVAFWLALGVVTFFVLLAGYGSGFWR